MNIQLPNDWNRTFNTWKKWIGIVLIGLIPYYSQGQSCMYNNASSTTDLINARGAGFTEMIVALWSVQPNGDITWGSNVICSNGAYTMDNYVEQYSKNMNEMKGAPGSSIKRIEVGIGGWGNTSYDNVRNLINSQGTGSGSILYRNFAALKRAIPAIDAVNNDDENTYDLNTTVAFGVMLADLGFKYTLAPYMNRGFWQTVVSQVNSQRANQIDRMYVQLYAGGRGNNLCDWRFGVPVWAGYYDVEDSYSHIQSDLATQKNNCSAVGGFMWFDWGNDKRTYSDIINGVYGVNVPARISASTGLVTTYVEFNAQGYSAGFALGDYNINDIKNTGMPNDAISGIHIPQGIKVTLYADANFSGTSIDLTSNVDVFSSQWNNQVSSMRVRANGDPSLDGQTFLLRNHNSNLYLDVPGASTADGVQLQQWGLNVSNSQRFKFTNLGDGLYSIQNVNSGKVIDVDGAKNDNGTKIQQWGNANGINQKFIAYKMSDGSYKFIIPYNGHVMDMPGWPTNQGGLVAEYENFSVDGQYSGMWYLEPSPDPNTGVVSAYTDPNGGGYSTGFAVGDYTLAAMKAKGFPDNVMSCLRIAEGFKVTLYSDDNFTGNSIDLTSGVEVFSSQWDNQVSSIRVRPNGNPNLAGTYYVKNGMSGLCMDVWGLATNDGAGIMQGAFNGGANQKFKFVHLGDGAYKIISQNSGKVMDVTGASQKEGTLIVQWSDAGGQNQTFILVDAGNGLVKLIAEHSAKVVEVSTNNSGEQLHQWWNAGQANSTWSLVPVVITVVTGNGDGLTGNYFNGMNFETPVYNRVDANINVDWGNGSPNAAVNADQFSARWSGQIQPKYSENYTFHLNTDNGRRLWINGQLIIDKWIDDWGIDYTGTIALVAGQKYDIKLEYFENYGGANAKFEWESTSQSREVVPQSQLYSNPLPTVSISSPSNNATLNAGTITISANASDNGSVSKVEFYNGAALLGTSTASPYSYSWTGVAAGSYNLTARATDNQGGITVSSTVGITVKAVTVVNKPPVVTLTSPANGSSYNATASITVSATASDADGSVVKVEFYNGATLLSTSSSSPYSYTWTGVGAGTYTLSAKAYDNSGAVTTSGSANVTVNKVVTNACSGVSAYVENNGYVEGSKVQNAGSLYVCKPWPYSGWCNGAAWAYGPGTGAYWTDAWTLVSSCTGRTGQTNEVASTDMEENAMVYPNPATDQITVQVTTTAQVSVYNSQGAEVLPSSSIASTQSIDISSLAAGMYLVKIQTGSDVITRQVVKR
ncbi:MAG: Ricin lectin [Chitinophagaceae bacterium]|nr:Ricin lectin [Chitinophagaceae bacterium]